MYRDFDNGGSGNGGFHGIGEFEVKPDLRRQFDHLSRNWGCVRLPFVVGNQQI